MFRKICILGLLFSFVPTYACVDGVALKNSSILKDTGISSPHTGLGQGTLKTMLQDSSVYADQTLGRVVKMLVPGHYPHYTMDEAWKTTEARAWTSGFFSGVLWLMYQQTHDELWKTYAEQWQAGLESQKSNTSTHDLGFMLFNSFGNGYRLTKNEHYRQVVLEAARSLATRYSPVVGSLKSWDHGPETDFQVIIDNMMNLELLFWASQNGGEAKWRDLAISHALKTAHEHVRPDGSTYHVVTYDPATGNIKSKCTHQGYQCESTWSRGQAWAIYGFTMSYRYTHDARFLNTAIKVADYFIDHLPDDFVPYWDFNAPSIPNEPRDSSAAAIAASGLLELSQWDADTIHKQKYWAIAQKILASLSSAKYLAKGTSSQSILLHGTSFKAQGNFDTGLIYGDYYFLEAMSRYQDIAH